uniref:Btsp n=1 Tax=Ixodes ricinus TaxID=34613 RepID=V5GJP9_IXORI
MGLTETTLVLVSLGFFASAAAHNCQNGTRPASEENREGCDYYCWNAETKSWDKFFFGNGERCFVSSKSSLVNTFTGSRACCSYV